MKKGWIVSLALLLLVPWTASGEAAEEIYRIVDESGTYITHYSGTPEAGDEYIAHDNTWFAIRTVDAATHTALAESKGKSLSGEVFDLRPERLSVEDFVALTNYFED